MSHLVGLLKEKAFPFIDFSEFYFYFAFYWVLCSALFFFTLALGWSFPCPPGVYFFKAEAEAVVSLFLMKVLSVINFPFASFSYTHGLGRGAFCACAFWIISLNSSSASWIKATSLLRFILLLEVLPGFYC